MKKNKRKILIVDDEVAICEILSHLVEEKDFNPLIAYNGDVALKTIKYESPDLVLLDFIMPGMNGLEVIKLAKELAPNLPIIMITAYGTIQSAVTAIKAGAYNYLAKPFNHEEVINLINLALAKRTPEQEKTSIAAAQEPSKYRPLGEMMGYSKSVNQIISSVYQVAKSNFTVLIQGETGSGKELVARAIHNNSQRSNAPFIAVDCGAIPESLLESELFGYEKGAFTGAHLRKSGKFELAQKGTLFLDEVSNMPLSSQVKLLRVLQDKVVYRVGSTKPIEVDIRLIAASNETIPSLVGANSFRRDLFFRLNEFVIKIPPLRERKEDIIYLANRFRQLTNFELNKSISGFSELATEKLLTYNWPGNVRQLRSTIRRAVLLAEDIITTNHLDISEESLSVQMESVKPLTALPIIGNNYSLKDVIQKNIIAIEREVLTQALYKTGGNKAKAARLLHIDYKTIHSKVKEYGIITK